MRMLRTSFTAVVSALLFFNSGCSAALVSHHDGDLPPVLVTPNPTERASYLDVIRDEYPDRYPQYDAFETMETSSYALSLPKGWRLDEKPVFPDIYDEKNEVVGKIHTYSIGMGINPPSNHTGLLERGEADINGTLRTYMVYTADYPAAYGSERIDIKQSVCFTINDGTGCFLTFHKAYFEHNAMHYIMTSDTVIQIAKTFRMK